MTRHVSMRGAVAAVLVLLTCGGGNAAEPFPFDRELLLDSPPIRPGKRMPLLTVGPSGSARIDLWCRTVPARIELSAEVQEAANVLRRFLFDRVYTPLNEREDTLRAQNVVRELSAMAC